MSMLCASPYRPPKPIIPIETQLPPRFGLGALESYTNEQMLTQALSEVHENAQQYPSFTLPAAPDDGFFYYMAPVEYGAVTFRDAGGLVGGWDGASWPLDDMADTTGPVEVMYQGHKYNLYRTDWPGSRGGTFTVSFANG